MIEQRNNGEGYPNRTVRPVPDCINESDHEESSVPFAGPGGWAEYDILDFANYDFTRSQIVRDERGWCLIVRDRYGCWAHVAGPFRSRREARDKLRRVIGRQMECEAEIEWLEAELAVAGPDSPLRRHDGEEPTLVLTRHLRWSEELDIIRTWSPRYESLSTWAYKYRSDCGCYVVGESETGEWVVRFRGVPLIGVPTRQAAMDRADAHRSGWSDTASWIRPGTCPAGRAPLLPERTSYPKTAARSRRSSPPSLDRDLPEALDDCQGLDLDHLPG